MKKILAFLMALTLLGVMGASVFAATSSPAPAPVSPTPVAGLDPSITQYPDGTIIITTAEDSHVIFDIDHHWGKEAIINVILKKLMIGYEDGMFHPDDGMTAAMVYTVMARLLDANVGTTGPNWKENVVAWAKATGIALDIDPDANIDRSQMIQIFAAVEKVEGDAVEWAKTAGLVVGDENGDLMLDKQMTRAEFATVLTRYIDFKGLEGVIAK